VIALLWTNRMRLIELASIRYDPRRNDIDLWTCHSPFHNAIIFAAAPSIQRAACAAD
jgi:hypothetical protein